MKPAQNTEHHFRSKEVTETRIDCPKHGLSKTYILYRVNKDIKGCGCGKCYKRLPVVNLD